MIEDTRSETPTLESAPSEDSRSYANGHFTVGRLLGAALRSGAQPRAAIIGFPFDEGVQRNGGRAGAASAPDDVRSALFRLMPDPILGSAFENLLEHVEDAGNIEAGSGLSASQGRLATVVKKYLDLGAVPIIIGGGHETAFGHFLAYADNGQRVALMNFDAHADVRELIEGQGHSGSPFRQALLHPSGAARHYVVVALQPQSVARTHLNFLADHGADWLWRSEVTYDAIDELFAQLDGPTLVSFDMDAVDESCAPGVSAPCVDGLSSALWLRAARWAGRSRAVTSVDLCEVNPRVDHGGQTTRLAALTLWSVLHGLAEREIGSTNSSRG